MRFLSRLRLATLASAALLLTPGLAAAFTVQGLVGTGGYACLSTTATGSCQTDRDFETVNQAGSASGSIDYSGGASGTLDIDVTVGSILLDEQLTTVPASTGGFEDVARIVFTSVDYVMTGMTAIDDGAGVIQGLGAVSGTVSGSYETRDGSNNLLVGPTLFSSAAQFSNVFCPADGQGQCTFTVGFFRNTDPFRLSVQGVSPGNSVDYDFVHVFNAVVPEPSSAGLLLLGLVGLAARRRPQP